MKYESLNEKKVYRLIHFIYYTHQFEPKKTGLMFFPPNKEFICHLEMSNIS
jgi:hypothetical protein